MAKLPAYFSRALAETMAADAMFRELRDEQRVAIIDQRPGQALHVTLVGGVEIDIPALARAAIAAFEREITKQARRAALSLTEQESGK